MARQAKHPSEVECFILEVMWEDGVAPEISPTGVFIGPRKWEAPGRMTVQNIYNLTRMGLVKIERINVYWRMAHLTEAGREYVAGQQEAE